MMVKFLTGYWGGATIEETFVHVTLADGQADAWQLINMAERNGFTLAVPRGETAKASSSPSLKRFLGKESEKTV